MNIVQANGIEICYESYGDPNDKPMMLVSGAGGQLTDWGLDFIEELNRAGFYVVAFDNRDSGLSTKFGDADSPYALSDLAADGIALLDVLGIEKVHVLGASMGGVIVQEMLLAAPDRFLSVCAVMTTTGNPEVGQPAPGAMENMMVAFEPGNREEALDAFVAMSRQLNGSAFPFDADRIRQQVARGYDRGYHPEGQGRHVAAFLSSGDRTAKLSEVTVPTLVIHGTEDTLVGVSGGEALAAAIPGATLLLLDGVGHALPQGTWPQVLDAVVTNTQRAAATA